MWLFAHFKQKIKKIIATVLLMKSAFSVTVFTQVYQRSVTILHIVAHFILNYPKLSLKNDYAGNHNKLIHWHRLVD